MKTMLFDLAGEYYSLEEWCNLLTSNPGGPEAPPRTSIAMSFSRKVRVSSLEMSSVAPGESLSESTGSDVSLKNDKRIHFALFIGAHGGSRWSAPFSQFSAKNLDEELDIAARVFCQEDRNVEIHRHENKVELLSSVFKVYRRDFDSDDKTMLKGLIPYLGGKKRSDLSGMLLDDKKINLTWKEPELGRHTVSGPWYKKASHNKKSTVAGFAGLKIVKTNSPSHHYTPSRNKQALTMKGFKGRLPEN